MNNTSENKQKEALKNALLAVRKTRSIMDEEKARHFEPIAVIGAGCRFPGGGITPEKYWENLRNGLDSVREVPGEKWDLSENYNADPDVPGKMYSKLGGFLDETDLFEPEFFRITPREALYMDPQQRLLLECSWEGLESAGILPESLKGSQTGVYVGISASDYSFKQVIDLNTINAYSGTGSFLSVAAGRISFYFGLRGPSLSVDTACSSSLVSAIMAVKSLRERECNLALAGGVNLILEPNWSVAFSRLNALSADGHCKTFDASANGYVRGEGCGMLVLKRLSDALKDGDNIMALIRGGAINHDGHSSGLTVPSGPSQQAVMRAALENAKVKAGDVSYIEAHGTGTPLGDPTEVSAIGEVFSGGREQPLALGSVKTNIGHLESAAGVAGIIKVVMSLKNKELPPSLHFKKLNPEITLTDIPAVINDKLNSWKSSGRRLAGVSSFGIGGTNAHVILEESPEDTVVSEEELSAKELEYYLIPFSAQSENSLKAYLKSFLEYLKVHRNLAPADLYDIAYTRAVYRSSFSHRLTVAFRDPEDLNKNLHAFLEDNPLDTLSYSETLEAYDVKPVFVFGGQGAQWIGMGRELLREEKVFLETVKRIDALLEKYTGWSLIDELNAPEEQSRLAQTEVAQPAIFAIQMGLVALWNSRGIEPRAVIGHSIGELAAACTARVYSLEDGVKIVYHRSRLMQKATGTGKMAAVELSEGSILEYFEKVGVDLDIAAINSDTSSVVSGDSAAMETLLERLKKDNVRHKKLNVNYAFHSRQMDSYLPELKESLANLRGKETSIPFFSTLIGDEQEGAGMDAGYWANNVRDTVRFRDGISRLLEGEYNLFIEISPHPVLGLYIEDLIEAQKRNAMVTGSLIRNKPESISMYRALGEVYTSGYPVDWKKIYPQKGRLKEIPGYQWSKKSYWLEDVAEDSDAKGKSVGLSTSYPLLDSQLPSITPSYLYDPINANQDPSFMAGFMVLELLKQATLSEYGERAFSLKKPSFMIPNIFENPGSLQVSINASDSDSFSGGIYSGGLSKEGKYEWVPVLNTNFESEPDAQKKAPGRAAIEKKLESINVADLFAEQNNFESESRLRYIKEVWRGKDAILAKIDIAEYEHSAANYFLPPPLWNLGLSLWTALHAGEDTEGEILVPHKAERIFMNATPCKESLLWCYIKSGKPGKGGANSKNTTVAANITIWDTNEKVLLEMTGLMGVRIEAERLAVQNRSIETETVQEADNNSLWVRLNQADELDRNDILQEHIIGQIRSIMMLPEDKVINPREGFFKLGMDSIMAVQLTNRLKKSVRKELPRTLVFENQNIDALTNFLISEEIEFEKIKSPVAVADSGSNGGGKEVEKRNEKIHIEFSESLSDLSEDELADMLATELGVEL